MNNELFKPENNFSRLGKFFCKKNLLLFKQKEHLSNIKKLLASKRENNYNYIMNDILNYTSKNTIKFGNNIFDDNYENEHDKIIEKQMKKYLQHKDNYKYHSIHSNIEITKPKNQPEGCKLTLFLTENEISINGKSNKYSFEKKINRFNTKTLKKKGKNEGNKICAKLLKLKKTEMLKNKKNFNNSNNDKVIKQKQDKVNIKKLLLKKISHTQLSNKYSEKNNSPFSYNKTNFTTIETNKNNIPENSKDSKVYITKINLDNIKRKKTTKIEKKFSSLDFYKHIRGVNFDKMLSRTKKSNNKFKEIDCAYIPLTPKYDMVFPKTLRNCLYKEKTSRKDFHPKYRINKNEFFIDLDKVYDNYNNHKKSFSFSIDKISGRDKFNNKTKEVNDIEQKKFYQKNFSDIFLIDNRKSNDKKSIKDYREINSSESQIYNNYLENIFKDIMNKKILNEEEMNIDETKLKKIMKGNKINNNYKKLLNLFNQYKFLNEKYNYEFN